jgi:hypothetical protein
MNALLPAFLTAAGVVAIGGVAKLRSPWAATGALAVAGLRARPTAVRVLGAGEVALAAVCVIEPSTVTALALAAAYLAFAALVARVMQRSRGSAPCGCFGDEGGSANRWHLWLNLVAAAIALAAAVAPPSWEALDLGGIELVAFGAGVLASVYLAYLMFTALPEAWGSPSQAGAEGGRA